MTARRAVSFEVVGVAQPKGSAKAFVLQRAGQPPRAIVTSDNSRVKGWQQLVAEQAQTVAGGALFLGPTVLVVTVHLPRPISLPSKVRHHLTQPDLDKLLRSIGDALTGVLLLDDKQIVEIHARKVYARFDAAPRACITLMEAEAVFAAELATAGSLFD